MTPHNFETPESQSSPEDANYERMIAGKDPELQEVLRSLWKNSPEGDPLEYALRVMPDEESEALGQVINLAGYDWAVLNSVEDHARAAELIRTWREMNGSDKKDAARALQAFLENA